MGDSGRNAGFMIDVPHVTVGDPKFDQDHHKWRHRLNTIVIDRMRRIKNEHQLQVDWKESGKYLAAREKKCLPALTNLERFMEQIGGESQMLNRAQLADKLGTDYYLQGLYTPGTVLINPAETVRGLASVLPSNVQVFENTAVIEVIEGPTPKVRLASGKVIKTNKVILTKTA
ncbi:FAD-binding oxidoreductase [Salmonella enterica]|nr:FAD-binding oxidoreductase [Salmonella enterica subsp. arizonae serovar 63:z36:-]EAX0033818.1 FAD-binding oxidoreductase [Salmonella enterica]EBH9979101.1 FAD-binding oxidoreductase [Salmonella enterica subsp. arizonae serovar 40:z36:-]EBA5087819.1 FAD-binding oxidoreductase [Salmonella enterica]EDC3687458.1 FAD-binding oxidoreductase [Salmonella enterica]